MTRNSNRFVLLLAIALCSTGLLPAQFSNAKHGGSTEIAPEPKREDTRLLRQPTISRDHIAFVHGGDIWVTNRKGENARRLTVHPTYENHPHFSPNGKLIAFSGYYDGNQDVYVIPTRGGQPRRLTFHPGADLACGWTPDGKNVLFSSRRHSAVTAYKRLFTVPLVGGLPVALPMPMAEDGSYSASARQIAYTPLRDAFATWKRYRGGRTGPIWIFNLSTLEHREIPHQKATDTNPVWVGDKIYFLSDRNLRMNIFVHDLKTNKVRQVTRHPDFDVKWLGADKTGLVYEQAYRLHHLDLQTEESSILPIKIGMDNPAERIHFVKASAHIRNMNISPTGVRGLCATRGEIITVPLDKGCIRNLTNTPGVHDRDPAWSPDGKQIAWFADTTGEYGLHLIDQKGRQKPEIINLGAKTFYHQPHWSPDAKKIMYTDKRLGLYYLDLEKKKPVTIDHDNFDKFRRTLDPCWSPDSKWIAYTKRLDNRFRALFLFSLETGKSTQVTDGLSDARNAAFSRDGKYLFCLASTDFGLNTAWLDMSSYDRPIRRSVYVVVLNKDAKSPFAPQSDEEVPLPTSKKGKPKKKQALKIDLANIDQRILALPIPAGKYSSLATAAEGKVFYTSVSQPGSLKDLHRFDLKTRKSMVFLAGIRSFRISQDGKKLLYQDGKSNFAIIGTKGKPTPGKGRLDFKGAKIKVDPRAEWGQIFYETWRIFRDYFYVANMHGLNWQHTLEKYRGFLSHVAHRSDLNYLLSEMTAELVCGHVNIRGGDLPDFTPVPGGLLGADFEIVGGHYRFKKIYNGLNWNPGLHAPLTQPGIKVMQGEYLLAVNGIPLDEWANIHRLLIHTGGKTVRLTVNSKPNLTGAREIQVVPTTSDRGLRLRAWIENNRRRVDRLSQGRLAYIYMPNTAGAGYKSFNRGYFTALDKEGVVIDERFNGGGKVADYVINMLDRKLLCWWGTREGKPFPSPNACIFGPKVMIINQYAGSGGDAMPYFFRSRGLGKLVGKCTWGGLVGIYDYPPLIDGGRVTAPRMGIFSPEGKWIVENQGVAPDIEVTMTPKAVIKGGDPQLEKAVQVLLEQLPAQPAAPVKKPTGPIRSY